MKFIYGLKSTKGSFKGSPKYGYLVNKISWEDSNLKKESKTSDPSDYSKPYHSLGKPDSNHPYFVYVVKKAVTEEDKKALATVLRNERQENDTINFF